MPRERDWPLRDWDDRPWRELPEEERQRLALEEFALRLGPTLGPVRHHLIVLNDYQVANLRALLYAVESGEIEGWNTGDWVGEIPWRLPRCGAQGPNRRPKPIVR